MWNNDDSFIIFCASVIVFFIFGFFVGRQVEKTQANKILAAEYCEDNFRSLNHE